MVKFEVYIDEVCNFFGENVPRDARIVLISTIMRCLADQYRHRKYKTYLEHDMFIRNFSFGRTSPHERKYAFSVILCPDLTCSPHSSGSITLNFKPENII